MTEDERSRTRTEPVHLDPDEVVQHRPVDGEVQATSRSVRIGSLYGVMLLHRDHDLYVAENRRGRNLQDLIRARLQAERFSDDDAQEWAFRNWCRWLVDPRDSFDGDDSWFCDQVIQAALAYRDTGIPIDEAFGWTIRSVSARDAVRLRAHGWNPDAYSTLATYCMNQGAELEEADTWVESRIVWWRALRYLEAGLRLPEALVQETRRLEGADIDPAVDLLIALKTGPTQ
ncbi:hypothetical protein H5V45_09160 [Nocardioides sp. KIGAM211]|uniref:Uncharacterized protein n=1 Tax=Nocardioides luti TaxID=2761101 RepID=A0A7X0RG11_9ACTN|nr:hypothetical protein [Nocardioides luti]MBB6627490.1 hypothetical protein [Nocardioides luti]